MRPTPIHRRRRLSQHHLDLLDTLGACVRLSAAGCRLLAAHINGGVPGILVDRRPELPDLAPGALRMDGAGCYYRATLGGVRVSWCEPRRALAADREVAP